MANTDPTHKNKIPDQRSTPAVALSSGLICLLSAPILGFREAINSIRGLSDTALAFKGRLVEARSAHKLFNRQLDSGLRNGSPDFVISKYAACREYLVKRFGLEELSKQVDHLVKETVSSTKEHFRQVEHHRSPECFNRGLDHLIASFKGLIDNAELLPRPRFTDKQLDNEKRHDRRFTFNPLIKEVFGALALLEFRNHFQFHHGDVAPKKEI